MLYQIGETPYYIDIDKHGSHLVQYWKSKKGGFYKTILSYSNLFYLLDAMPDFFMGCLNSPEPLRVEQTIEDYKTILEELTKLVKSDAFKQLKAAQAQYKEAIKC